MKILIVEDEINILEGIVNIVKYKTNIPCKVKYTDSAKEAMHIAEDFYPDLVITDIVMPQMSGLDMIRHMRSRKLCDHFIILSGHDSFEFARQALRYGVIDYLLKPIDTTKLIEQVQTMYASLPQIYHQTKARRLPDLDYFKWDPDTEDAPSSYKKVLSCIEKNYMKDINLQAISEELFFHPNYISSLISKYTGHSFTYLMDYVRIKKAADLLLFEPDLSISEISYLVGYNNDRRLYHAFKKRLDMTPGDFRKNYLQT